MAKRINRYLLTTFLVVAGLLLSVLFGLLPVNLFFAKTSISDAVVNQLGAELDIQGPLRIRFGFKPVLSASEITLTTAGKTGQPLLRVDRLTIRPRLLEVLRGQLHMRSLEASGISFDYCPEPFSVPASESSNGDLPSIELDSLGLTGIKPHCAQAERRLEFLPDEFDLAASAARDNPLEVQIDGRKGQQTMLLAATGGSLDSLLADTPDYPLDLELRALSSEFRFSGFVGKPLSEPVLDAGIELLSERPDLLWEAAGIGTAAAGALKIEAQILLSADELRFDGLKGSLGRQELEMSGLARDFSSRPYFEIDARLARLDFELFFDGRDESTGDGEQKDQDFQPLIDFLATFDARLKLGIDQLLNTALPVDSLLIEAGLDHGLLTLDQADLMLASSPVTVEAVLDMQPACAQWTSKIQLSEVDLGHLVRFMDLDPGLGGRLERASINSSSCGLTLQEHIGSLSLEAGIRGVQPGYRGEDLPLTLNALQARIDWNEPGRLSLEGTVLGEAVSSEIDFGSVDALVSEASWPLEMSASGAGAQLEFSGQAALRAGQVYLDAGLALDLERFGSLHRWIGANQANNLPLHSQARVKLDSDGLAINGLDATLGQSDIGGQLSWAAPGTELPMILDLQSDRLNIDELYSLWPEPAHEPEKDSKTGREPRSDTEWLDEWLDFPQLDFDLALNQFDGLKLSASRVGLHGHLRERLIEDGRFDLLLEDIGIAGSLEVDFRQHPWTVSAAYGADNISIGRLLARLDLLEGIEARADRMDFKYVSEGYTIPELVENSRLDTMITSLHWFRETTADKRGHDFHLSELALTAAPSLPTVWRSHGDLNGTAIRAWMQTPSIKDTFDQQKDLPLTVVFSTGDEVLMMQSLIGRKDHEGRQVEIKLSGQHMDPAGLDFSGLESPLDDYEISSSVLRNDDGTLFSDLEARIGASRASGRVNIQREDSRRRFDITLNSPYLETDDLVDWVELWRRSGDQQAGIEGSDPDLATMVNQRVNDLVQNDTFNIRIEIDDLRSAGTPLGKAQLGLRADEHEIHLDPLQITLPAGMVDVKYIGRQAQEGLETELNIRIDGLEYGGLLRLLDPESRAQGQAYMSTALVSRAANASRLLSRLEGQFDMVLIPEDVSAGFLDLWTSNLVFALLPSGPDKRKKLNCLVASFEVEDGVMTTKNTLLDSTEVIIRGRGTIDLANRELDLLFAPQSKREKFLSVSAPIEVTGPFNDFEVGVTNGGFVMTLFRWYMGLIYVPYKWLTGERFPADGIETCFNAVDLEPPTKH